MEFVFACGPKLDLRKRGYFIKSLEMIIKKALKQPQGRIKA